ncbi:MAG TPA: hypothetical protein VIN35_11840 [Hydrogenophaga sp.]
MANVREMLARLNPSTVKFDIGSGGGAPDLTPQDIAAALAMVPAGLGREVFCHLWWPDGARLTAGKLHQEISRHIWRQIEQQNRRLVTLRLEVSILEDDIYSRNAVPDETRRALAAAQAKRDLAARACWPQDARMVTRVRMAVLEEMARPNHCRACKGRGQVLVGEATRICPTCSGRRVLPVSNRDRARAIGRDESTYRERWRPMYEWLWGRLNDSEQAAAQDFLRALGRGLEQAA